MIQGRRFSILVFVFGAMVMVSQIVLVRELMNLSLGSELAIGLVFAGWLAGVAAGSALAGFLRGKEKASLGTISLSLFVFVFSIPACIILARCIRTWAGYFHGDTIPFTALLWMIPVSSAPAAFMAGLCFVLLGAEVAEKKTDSRSTWGSLYANEAAGSIAGSLAFTFILVFWVPPITLVLCMGCVMLFVLALCAKDTWRVLAGGALLCIIVCATLAAQRLDRYSRAIQWNNADIAASEESAYGNITALREKGQIDYFTSGRFAGVAAESPGAAFTAHVPMSMHPHPRRVLVAGGGVEVVREILKHNPDLVTVVELDPVLWSVRERFLPVRDLKLLNDKRVHIEITDARSFIEQAKTRYDVIIVAFGEPENLLINRYYTQEFYSAVKSRLDRDGLFATTVTFQRNSTSAWQADLLGVQYKTIDSVFQRPLLLPGQANALLVASNGRELSYDPVPSMRRFMERSIESDRFAPTLLMEALDENMVAEALKQPRLVGVADAQGLLEYDMKQDRVGYVFNRLMQRRNVFINRDFAPVSTYYQARVSSEFFRGSLHELLERATKKFMVLGAIACIAVLALLTLALRLAGVAGRTTALAAAATAAGFAGLVLEIVILFFLQVRNGAVYHFVGMVLAAFMAGGWAGSALCSRAKTARPVHVAAVLFAMAALCVLLAAGNVLSSADPGSPTLWISFACALLTGALVGACYALCTAIAPDRKSAAIIYGADHAGAALGALISSALLIPLAGLQATLWLCAAVLAAGVACVFAPGRS